MHSISRPEFAIKLALFRVPYALRATYIPSLRFGTGKPALPILAAKNFAFFA
ncbi:MAG: hypothetical protein PUJ82_02755 [Spirochaetales bacterium]|nr:hypothetical protein [Spirochaetales bacterium]